MEIEATVNELFESANKPKRSNAVDTGTTDLKRIEFQMNNYLKSKHGQKAEKVSIFNFDTKTSYNEETFGQLVDKEIESKYQNTKWSKLPSYLKWKLAQEYFAEKEIVDAEALQTIKDAINRKKDGMIVYDHVNHKITDIALQGDSHTKK